MAKKNPKEKTKAPDYLADVVQAVTNYDDVRLKRREIKNETQESLHKKAVRVIGICNGVHGEGFTSISKARTIISSQWHEEKVKFLVETTKCSDLEAREKIKTRQAERKGVSLEK